MPAIDIPAPTGGWNARDSMAAMQPTDAVTLQNLIPRDLYCESRRGCIEHVTGLGGSVESLLPYRGSTTPKLLAAADGELWDVTTSGAPASLDSGFTTDLWQSAHHSDLLILTNGFDAPMSFNGTALSDLVITGVTATTLWGCSPFKGRMFYWQQNAQSYWYAAAGSYQGALVEFDLSTVCSSGGTLVQVLTWTLDAGDGVDDLAVFLFSTGEALVYQGDDPGDSINWAKIGSFKIGEPISIRSHAQVANTEIIATRDGYLDLSAALKSGRYSDNTDYSNKISRAAKQAALQYAGNAGWACVLYPAGNLFLVNVPISALQSVQHVRETNSGGWCSFTNWNARSFAVFNDRLYFGDPDGRVMYADIGVSDDGDPIPLVGIPAFSALGSKARRKQLTAVSIVSNYEAPAFWALDGLADYAVVLRSAVRSDLTAPASSWDTSDWDTTFWATDDDNPQAQPRAWRNLTGAGYALTCAVRLNSQAQTVVWYSTGYLYKSLGAI